MDKSKKTDMEEAFCEYLAKNFRGANNPVSSKTLEAVFRVKGTEIRRIVNSLRCKGEPICSDMDGYYFADNQYEVNATIAQLSSRIQKIAKARDGLLNRDESDS